MESIAIKSTKIAKKLEWFEVTSDMDRSDSNTRVVVHGMVDADNYFRVLSIAGENEELKQKIKKILNKYPVKARTELTGEVIKLNMKFKK